MGKAKDRAIQSFGLSQRTLKHAISRRRMRIFRKSFAGLGCSVQVSAEGGRFCLQDLQTEEGFLTSFTAPRQGGEPQA